MGVLPSFVPLSTWRELPADEMVVRSREFADELARRRTVRQFSDRPIPPGVLEHCLRAAASAPSGANLQPWQFVVVTDPGLKREIRAAAEREERAFYATAPAEWLEALAPLGTDEDKPYLETAPALIAVFAERYGLGADGTRVAHYYVQESVGIAMGMLITALHHAGLVTLTHTPSPMGFLSDLLGRPAREKAVLLLVVGFPAPGARVPDISRKPLTAVVTWR
jgi:iodotyrosine deiodinase